MPATSRSWVPPSGALETGEWEWTNPVTVDTVVDMITSRSYVIALAEAQRSELVRRLRELAEGAADRVSGLVPVSYVTRAYRAMRP